MALTTADLPRLQWQQMGIQSFAARMNVLTSGHFVKLRSSLNVAVLVTRWDVPQDAQAAGLVTRGTSIAPITASTDLVVASLQGHG